MHGARHSSDSKHRRSVRPPVNTSVMDVPTLTSIAAVGVSVVPLIRGEIRNRRRAPEEARRAAVQGLSNDLLLLQTIIEHADVQRSQEADISAAMQRFERESQRWEDQLPEGAEHLRRSVREAMVVCFGAPAIAGIDPRAAGLPADEFDWHWWDISSSWLEHAQRQLQRWLIDNRRHPLKVIPYYQWRRDEDRPHVPKWAA